MYLYGVGSPYTQSHYRSMLSKQTWYCMDSFTEMFQERAQKTKLLLMHLLSLDSFVCGGGVGGNEVRYKHFHK